VEDLTQSPPSSDQQEAHERSLPDEMRQLATDARALAEAELAYQKSRAAFAGNEAKWIAILAVLALFFVFFTLMALIMGTVIALGPILGLWGATAAVTGGLLVAVLICGGLIMMRIRRMKAVLKDEKPD